MRKIQATRHCFEASGPHGYFFWKKKRFRWFRGVSVRNFRSVSFFQGAGQISRHTVVGVSHGGISTNITRKTLCG